MQSQLDSLRALGRKLGQLIEEAERDELAQLALVEDLPTDQPCVHNALAAVDELELQFK